MVDISKVAEIVSSASDAISKHLDPIAEKAQPYLQMTDKLPPIFEMPSKLLASQLAKLPEQGPGIDYSDPLLSRALIVITLGPLIWNLIGRFEYKTGIVTKICFGSKYVGCYALATWIFCFSLFRDKVFVDAIHSQPQYDLLAKDEYMALAGILVVFGTVMVVSAYLRLGIAGTYLGDYFGILFDEKIEGFPFTVTSHPMYDGASMLFFAKAITSHSLAGVLLSSWVFIVYRIASIYEESFTEFIYLEKARKEALSKKPVSATSTTAKAKTTKTTTPKKTAAPKASTTTTKQSKTNTSSSASTKKRN